jgi:NhaP-type Na+/H+ or K+/H+ antiporter
MLCVLAFPWSLLSELNLWLLLGLAVLLVFIARALYALPLLWNPARSSDTPSRAVGFVCSFLVYVRGICSPLCVYWCVQQRASSSAAVLWLSISWNSR